MENKPLLSDGFIKWVIDQDFNNKTILEIGSGFSTLFFSNYFDKVNSFESDILWYDTLSNMINEKKIKNVTLNLMNIDILNDIHFLNLVKTNDAFLIDNNPRFLSRFNFVKFIHNNKKLDSIIIFDNGDWHKESYEFLRTNYYCLDFLRTEHERITQTSVFFGRRNNLI